MFYSCRKNKKRLKKTNVPYLKIWITRTFLEYCNEYYTLYISISSPYIYSYHKLKDFIKNAYYLKI